MTYHDMDPNRPPNDPYVRRPIDDARSGMGYAWPIGLAALAVILGVIFFMPSNERTTTAANDAPVSRQVNPSTPTPNPVPAPTPPTKTQ